MKYSRTHDSSLIAKLNEHVHTIHNQLYPEYFKEYDYHNMKQFFDQHINKEEFIFLVIEDLNIPLGYAWIEIKINLENAFSRAYRSIYVHQISIIESFKGKGYGSKLMSKIYDIAKLYGIKEVKLDYWIGNNDAANFYKKQGFNKIREYVVKRL